VSSIPNVQRVKRANGRVDLYFRKGAYRQALTAPDGSEELRAEVEAILKRIAKAAEATAKPIGGTVGAMLKTYNRAAEFLMLAGSTQREYQRLIDELIADCGDVMLPEVDTAWVKGMRDVWALRGHKAANDRLQVLKNAVTPALEDDRIKGDPFAKVKKIQRPHDAGETNPAWEQHEVDAAIALAIARKKPGLARAIALGRYGGYRRGTICALPLNARTNGFDAQGRPEIRHYHITAKRKVVANKREDGRLTAVLAATANKGLMLAYNARGEAWQPRQLNQAIERLVGALAKAGRARAVLTIHGLRHARGVELAEAGASDAEIMSQLEHATDRAAKIYRRQADRRKMADAGQDRVDNVVKLRAKAAERKAQ
jgi:hypothetical protein